MAPRCVLVTKVTGRNWILEGIQVAPKKGGKKGMEKNRKGKKKIKVFD